MYQLAQLFSIIILPIIIISIPLYALYKKVEVYDSFIEGAKEGFPIIIKLIPHLVGMMTAVAIFRETGAINFYLNLLSPLAELISIPPDIIPIGMVRPLTSSGSLALMESALRTYGPDSIIGRIASTIQGSSETTIYVIAVYFGAINIKRSLYSLKVGLLADLASFIFGILFCYLLFS